MLDKLMLAALVMGAVNALFGAIAVRRLGFLEQKLRVFWRVVLVQGVAMALVWIALLIRGSEAPRLSGVSDASIEELRGYLIVWHDYQKEGILATAAMPFLLVILVPAALHVLGELRRFVLTHRADLLARDQAAAWEAPQRKSEPAAKI